MKQIEKKSPNVVLKLKAKIVEFRREICFRFKNFLHEKTKDMCFNKEELNSINERVKTTKNKERKFDEFSEIAPEILNLIENLRGDIEKLKAEKEFCMNGIQELYIADRNGDVELKKILFGKFGLPYVLNDN
jgi:archaellum component FlaC